MRLSLIVAMTPNRVIGRDGRLPWHLSADLQRFKRLTMGHHIIMGRATYESIGRLLPGRKTVVVSRQPDLVIDGALVAPSVPAAVRCCQGDSEVFFVGGRQVYREALQVAQRMYLTLVQADVAGDTYFPEITARKWKLVEQEHHEADQRNEYDYTFQVFERVGDASESEDRAWQR